MTTDDLAKMDSIIDGAQVGRRTGKQFFFVPLDEPMRDVIGGKGGYGISVLDHGHVSLIDVMPRVVPAGRTCDVAVVEAARTSTGGTLKTPKEDRALIRYLMRHRHTTPFEMVRFKFHCRLPIFVARQWIRHRMSSYNEFSARYATVPDVFYVPKTWRGQSKTNKQAGEQPIDYKPGEYAVINQDGYGGTNQSAEQIGFHEYKRRTAAGVARELARTCLPVSAYTEWVWCIDLHNLMRFLGLRMDAHAQLEIREYADAIFDLIERLVPDCLEAWQDFEFLSVRLSRLEVDRLRAEVTSLRQLAGEKAANVHGPLCENEGENREWEAKRKLLGLAD